MPESWYIYETNQDERIKTYSPSLKKLVVW